MVMPVRRPPRRVLPVVVLLGALAALTLSRPVVATTCDRSGCGRIECGAPALPVASGFWGALQPVDTAFTFCTKTGPQGCRDSTAFNEFVEFYNAFPWYMALDIENDWLFVAIAHGLQVWNPQTDPAHPTYLGKINLSSFPVQADSAEIKWPLRDVDAPPGVDNTVAVSGVGGIGLVVLETTDKTKPLVSYQSYRKDAEQVHATTIGTRHYAFLAGSGSAGGGLFAYDLDKARTFGRCSEGFPAAGEAIRCPGVYLGKIGTRTPVYYVDGVDEYVVASSGPSRGFEIWNVTNPQEAQLELSGPTDKPFYGVAMWKDNGHYYLAARVGVGAAIEGQIFDVSCIAAETPCTGLGPALSKRPLDSGTPGLFVTFSRAGSIPMLYYGSDNKCAGGVDREWVYNVSDPANPVSLATPGYFSWYYRGSTTGFNNIMPRSAKFYGAHLYRTALALFDTHVLASGLPPAAAFTPPLGPIWAGDAVQFHDASELGPTSWDWLFEGATVVTPQAATAPPER
jgi:hypothetical protein